MPEETSVGSIEQNQKAFSSAQTSQVAEKIFCPNCGKEMTSGTIFCGFCGYKMPQPEEKKPSAIFCPECGKELVPGIKFCSTCGYHMDGMPVVNLGPNITQVGRMSPYSQPNIIINTSASTGLGSTVAACVDRPKPLVHRDSCGLLAVFLGCFGAHDFYAENNTYGIIKLIGTLSCIGTIPIMIWVIVDVIRIILGSYKDGQGRVLEGGVLLTIVFAILPVVALIVVIAIIGAVFSQYIII